MSRFVPKVSVMALYDSLAHQLRAERIRGIRARLADGWRHSGWEARLYEAEKKLMGNARLDRTGTAGKEDCRGD